MDPLLWITLLSVLGIALLIAEALIPSHGLLGVMSALCFAGVIGVCFYLNQWLGLGVLTGGIVASPFLGAFLIEAWKRTPVGKRMVLTATVGEAPQIGVRVGQVGLALSELRPSGEVDFDDQRVQAVSEGGIIPVGSRVKVISVSDGIATVRQV
jgi:membrane-bound ClpP family serine protease